VIRFVVIRLWFGYDHAAILGQTMAINAKTATFIMLQHTENITQSILICKKCIFLLALFNLIMP